MKGFALFAIFSVAAVLGAPVEDTPDVAAAKAEFQTYFAMADAGELANLAPVNNDVQAEPVVATYIADTKDVAAAKEKFNAAFEDAELAAQAASELLSNQLLNLLL